MRNSELKQEAVRVLMVGAGGGPAVRGERTSELISEGLVGPVAVAGVGGECHLSEWNDPFLYHRMTRKGSLSQGLERKGHSCNLWVHSTSTQADLQVPRPEGM